MAKTRRQLAVELIALERAIAPTVAKINAVKEALRDVAVAGQAGFTEDVDGDAVEVSAGAEAKLKGIMPVLKPEPFLALAELRREKLIADGVVAMEQQWTSARKPSVTVRLAGAAQARKR